MTTTSLSIVISFFGAQYLFCVVVRGPRIKGQMPVTRTLSEEGLQHRQVETLDRFYTPSTSAVMLQDFTPIQSTLPRYPSSSSSISVPIGDGSQSNVSEIIQINRDPGGGNSSCSNTNNGVGGLLSNNDNDNIVKNIYLGKESRHNIVSGISDNLVAYSVEKQEQNSTFRNKMNTCSSAQSSYENLEDRSSIIVNKTVLSTFRRNTRPLDYRNEIISPDVNNTYRRKPSIGSDNKRRNSIFDGEKNTNRQSNHNSLLKERDYGTRRKNSTYNEIQMYPIEREVCSTFKKNTRNTQTPSMFNSSYDHKTIPLRSEGASSGSASPRSIENVPIHNVDYNILHEKTKSILKETEGYAELGTHEHDNFNANDCRYTTNETKDRLSNDNKVTNHNAIKETIVESSNVQSPNGFMNELTNILSRKSTQININATDNTTNFLPQTSLTEDVEPSVKEIPNFLRNHPESWRYILPKSSQPDILNLRKRESDTKNDEMKFEKPTDENSFNEEIILRKKKDEKRSSTSSQPPKVPERRSSILSSTISKQSLKVKRPIGPPPKPPPKPTYIPPPKKGSFKRPTIAATTRKIPLNSPTKSLVTRSQSLNDSTSMTGNGWKRVSVVSDNYDSRVPGYVIDLES